MCSNFFGYISSPLLKDHCSASPPSLSENNFPKDLVVVDEPPWNLIRESSVSAGFRGRGGSDGGDEGKVHRTAEGFRSASSYYPIPRCLNTHTIDGRTSFDCSRFCLGLVYVGRSIGLRLGF